MRNSIDSIHRESQGSTLPEDLGNRLDKYAETKFNAMKAKAAKNG